MDARQYRRPGTGTTDDGRPATRRGTNGRPSTQQGFERPMSRRGMSERPGSAARGALRRQGSASVQMATEHPVTQQQWNRPASSGRAVAGPMVPSTPSVLRNAPGTATRLATAMMMQQTVSRLPSGIGLAAQVNVVDRPITQQGLSGLKTGVRGPQRQVHDKSYFIGILRSKMSELNGEITHMRKETYVMSKEQSTYLAYEQRVKEVAAELTGLQGQMADYNLLLDKLSTDTEKSEVENEFRKLKARNDVERKNVENLFLSRQEKDADIKELEKELDQERRLTDAIMETMNPELREKFANIKQSHTGYQGKQDKLQQRLDKINGQKAKLTKQIAHSQVKRKAVTLLRKMKEMTRRRNTLREEERTRKSPTEEREMMLMQVKNDNVEIATMERQLSEVREQIKRVKEDVRVLDQEIAENHSERNQKYRELKKKEEVMEEFLSSFEETKSSELQRIQEAESTIIDMLGKMSLSLIHFNQIPSVLDFAALKEDLVFKEGELNKSRMTLESLTVEHQQLQVNYQKVEILEDKMKQEAENFHEKIRTMQEEMVKYTDLDTLNGKTDTTRKELIEKREELLRQKNMVVFSVDELQKKIASLNKQLDENEANGQLRTLEKKLISVEQSNFAIQEYLANEQVQSNSIPLKNKVMSKVTEYNKFLQKAALKNGVIT